MTIRSTIDTAIGLFVGAMMATQGFAASFDVPAQELGNVAQEAVTTAAFYLGNMTAIGVLLTIAVCLRLWVWAQYILLALLGLIYIGFFEQNITGIVWTGLDLSIGSLLIAGYAMLSINYLVAANAVPADHKWAFLKLPYRLAAGAIWGLCAIGLYGSPETGFLLFSIAGCTVAAAHFAPVSTFSKLRGGYDTFIRNLVWGLLVCVLIGATFVIASDVDTPNVTVAINRFLIAAIIIGFGALFIRNIFVLQSDRELAVREALERAEEKARISEALLEARDDYQAALDLARARSQRLASASHDIRQPLSSLRTSFAAISKNMPEETRTHLQTSLSYLDDLASSYLDEGHQDDGNSIEALARKERIDDPATEVVQAEHIGGTLSRMFKDDAAERDLLLTTNVAPAAITTQPLALMRTLCNIVSNAIAHGTPGQLELLGATGPDTYTFTVRNPGSGELSFNPWEKGDDSDGHGLGLSIVSAQAAEAGFAISSEESTEDTVSVSVTVPLTPKAFL